jgi:hypothetical protein
MRRRRGLFNGWWFDPVDGRRLRRPTRSELSAAPKLWASHADIRVGRAKGMRR